MWCIVLIIAILGQTDLRCKNQDMHLGSSGSMGGRSWDPGGKAATARDESRNTGVSLPAALHCPDQLAREPGNTSCRSQMQTLPMSRGHVVRAEWQPQVGLAPKFRLPDIGRVTEFEFLINNK